MKLTAEQYHSALTLGNAFGHAWAQEITDIKRTVEAHGEGYLTPKRLAFWRDIKSWMSAPSTEAIEDTLRNHYEREGDRDCPWGITSPSPIDADGVLDHISHSQRIGWTIRSNGSVTILINRPNRPGLIKVDVTADGTTEVACDHPEEVAGRHLDEVQKALSALIGRERANTELAKLRLVSDPNY